MSSSALSKSLKRIADVAARDGRYKVDAYLFVHQTLAFVELRRGKGRRTARSVSTPSADRHLSGQQLCEAIRQYAQELYGLMAQLVLKSWGVRSTSDFGEIVYQLIDIGEMTKSETDLRCDFDDVFEFDCAFRDRYEFTLMDEV